MAAGITVAMDITVLADAPEPSWAPMREALAATQSPSPGLAEPGAVEVSVDGPWAGRANIGRGSLLYLIYRRSF